MLLDLRMPGLDGMEVLRRVRSRPNAPPVVILTAVPTRSNTIEAIGSVPSTISRNQWDVPIGRLTTGCWLRRERATVTIDGSFGRNVGFSVPMREVQKSIGSCLPTATRRC